MKYAEIILNEVAKSTGKALGTCVEKYVPEIVDVAVKRHRHKKKLERKMFQSQRELKELRKEVQRLSQLVKEAR